MPSGKEEIGILSFNIMVRSEDMIFTRAQVTDIKSKMYKHTSYRYTCPYLMLKV